MRQQYEGDEHTGEEDGVDHVTLPPAIAGNERRAPRCQEEGAYTRARQRETGGESTSTGKPPGDQGHRVADPPL
jgi:hypothetical protein